MSLNRIDHVTILCADVERSVAFYRDVLGMSVGDRPPFSFPGAWMYVDGHSVVHLVGGRNAGGMSNTGSFDHVAFDASDLPGTLNKLRGQGIDCREQPVPGRGLHQVFMRDPDGVKIELNFRVA